MNKEEKHTIFCTNCGAEFDENLPECPYCGTMNYKGAEAEYLKKLEQVREDLDDLQDIPDDEMKEEIKNQLSRVKKIFIILGSIVIIVFALFAGVGLYSDYRSEKWIEESYKWADKYTSEFDELYEKEDYDGMMELYYKLSEKDDYRPPYSWKYYGLISMYDKILCCEDLIKEHKDLKSMDKNERQVLFYYEWTLYDEDNKYKWENISDKDKEMLKEKSENIIKDMETRFNLTLEDKEKIEELKSENHGVFMFKDAGDMAEELYNVLSESLMH